MATTPAPHTLDVSHLPAYDVSSQAPLWWGQLCIAFIEGTMFCILIAAFLYVRLRYDVWPPPGDQFPSRVIPTLALIPLLLSCIGSYWASESAKKNNRRGMLGGLIFNFLLGCLFFYMRILEWRALNFSWKSDAFGSYVWAFLGLHSFDLMSDLIFTAVLILIVATGHYGEKQRLGVHVDSVVWYFLVIIWVPVYAVLYLGPHILESR
jgi:heme/copper-type cytochrome/quinol oxidase subunit 3